MLFLFGDYRINEKSRFTDVMREDGFAYKVIPDAGHALNMEQPDRVNDEIAGFIAAG